MITTILSGGLGNQMFQYAAGRALSIRLNTELCIDSFLLRKKTKSTKRDFDLKIFNIDVKENDSLKNKFVTKGHAYFKKYGIKNTLHNTLNIFQDNGAQHYDSAFENLTDNYTLFGYFQNQKYFQEITNIIKKDFEFSTPGDRKNVELIGRIDKNTSVSVHIRRGDYLNSNTNLAVIDLSYHEKAISRIKEKTDNPHFFIFSDDIEWVQQNLNLKNTNHTFVDFNHGENSFRDLQLMSLCQHNIIANSSFSWWGAWLNSNTDKIVICPDRWYKTDNKKDFSDGFIPKEWTILE